MAEEGPPPARVPMPRIQMFRLDDDFNDFRFENYNVNPFQQLPPPRVNVANAPQLPNRNVGRNQQLPDPPVPQVQNIPRGILRHPLIIPPFNPPQYPRMPPVPLRILHPPPDGAAMIVANQNVQMQAGFRPAEPVVQRPPQMPQPNIANNMALREIVMNEILAVAPDINRQWLMQRTGYNREELMNWILDNIEEVPMETHDGPGPMDETLSVTIRPDRENVYNADWLLNINTPEKKDAIVQPLIDFYKASRPDNIINARPNNWIALKSYVEKRFRNIYTTNLQRIFNLPRSNYKMSMSVAVLVSVGKWTNEIMDELGAQSVGMPKFLLNPRPGKIPAIPAFLEEAVNAVVEVVERALGTAMDSCCVCYEDFMKNNLLHCGEDDEDELHYICSGCFREQGRALCTDGKLADGGQGMRCVDPSCSRIYQWATVKQYLDKKTRRLLGRRIDQEALVAIGEELEYCKRCDNAMIIEATKEELKYFNCFRCKAHFCRSCHVNWNLHAGKKCDEMPSAEDLKDLERRKLEEELAAAILRKCHRCGVQFAKEEGCNKMTCRCGATQCYPCRAVNIGYDHFCNHVHDPIQGCPLKCNGCILWEKTEKINQAAVDAVKRRALMKNKDLQDVISKLE